MYPPDYGPRESDWEECSECEGAGCAECNQRGEVPNTDLSEHTRRLIAAERNRY